MAECMEDQIDFLTQYTSFCLKANVCPLKSVIKHIKGSELSLPVESIRREQWITLITALYNDNYLSKIHFASSVSPHRQKKCVNKKRGKSFPTPYGRSNENLRNISLALGALLHSSGKLVILKLENLSLTVEDAEQLSSGLSKAILKVFSLSGCRLEEGACEILCNGLQLSNIAWIDFSSCNLNVPDMEAVCKVIKSHKLRRSNEMFEQTLRYHHAVLDSMDGLNRLSLSYNIFGNRGVDLLVDALADDLWIKALDLQHCGIEDEGAEMLLRCVMTNSEIEVIDLRLNLIDYAVVQRIETQIFLNKSGKDVKYFPMPLWEPSELVRKYSALKQGKTVKKKTFTKVKFVKKVPRSSLNHSLRSSMPRLRTVISKDACVQTEDMIFCSGVPKNMQDLFNNLRNKLAFEMKLRKFFMQKYNSFKSENDQLRELLMKTQNDDIFIDQATYFEIKQTFEKLKIFFDVMKKYGLWEYIAVLGFDEAADIVMSEQDAQKCVKVKRKEPSPPSRKSSACSQEAENEAEPIVEPCCNCRRIDLNNKIPVTNKSTEVVQNCTSADKQKSSNASKKIMKGDIVINEKLAVKKIFQEVINNYGAECCAAIKQANIASGTQDNAKPSSSKDLDIKSQVSCAQMFLKKFSYSNMPKKVKELVSPNDFYKIVKQELERYEGEKRPVLARQDSSSQTAESGSNSIPSSSSLTSQQHCKKLSTTFKKIDKNSNTGISKSEYVPQPKSQLNSQRISKVRSTIDEDYDDISISELIARKRAENQASPKYVPTKKEPAKTSNSTLSSTKTLKIPKLKSISKQAQHSHASAQLSSEKILPNANLSSQTSKNIRATSNASSDEINSSDSVVTASDKMSDSSVSSSSSEQSLVKNSSDQNENELQKSYIESVSDASTFKDVESISDIEVGFHASSLSENKLKDQLNVSPSKADSVSSLSSVKKISKSKKDGKQMQSVASPSSSSIIKDAESKKSDKPVNPNPPPQGKAKNKQSGKNRPKGSSKSSSVPSLNDITTVSSQSLNTDSVMKQISGSEEDAKCKK